MSPGAAFSVTLLLRLRQAPSLCGDTRAGAQRGKGYVTYKEP